MSGASWRKSSFSFSNGNCAEVAAWRKSTASAGNGACAEVGARRKSSASKSGNCAEVGQAGAVVGVRDTKLAASPVLVFPAAAWAAFTSSLKDGPGRP